jgi:hypothetical protein
VLALCCFGGIGGGVWTFRQVINSTKPVTEAADAFFQALVGGDDAYDRLCAATSSAVSRAQFERSQTARPVAAYRVTNTNISNVNGRVSATVTVELRYADGNVETHVVPMAKENETWKVCGRPY